MAAHGAAVDERHQLSNGMLGFILFAASEVMFFGGLFAAYFIARADSGQWPPVDVLNNLKASGDIKESVELELEWVLPLIATIVLVISSVTMQLAVMAIQKGNRSGMIKYLSISVALGLSFLAMQMYDYSQLSFRAGDTIFGTTFYTLVGFHAFHVTIGLLMLVLMLSLFLRGRIAGPHSLGLELVSWYWHFVDVVWVVVFAVVYLFGR